MASEQEIGAEIREVTLEIRQLLTHLAREPHQNVQTVIHRSEGVTPWVAAAITACFCTWFGLILVMLDIHDLRAWVDVLKQRITAVEAKH